MTSTTSGPGELRAVLAELAACQRDLVAVAAEVDRAGSRTHDGWRDGFADMVTALAGLRAIAHAADDQVGQGVDVHATGSRHRGVDAEHRLAGPVGRAAAARAP